MKPTSLLLTCLVGLAVPMVGLAQPTITTQPQSQTNAVGSTVTLWVEAVGVLPLVYQWRKTGVPVAGATNAALVFTNIQSPQAGNYTVVITNVEGAVTSVVATLAVLVPPSIMPSASLQNKPAYVGTLASFTVTATGTAPLAFQWRLDGRELPGQTNLTLTLNAVQPADEGDYTVMVTNVAGAVVSEAARLYVVPASTNFILKNFTNATGLRLPYYFFLPSNYDPTRSYVLYLFFHGSPSDETTRESTMTPYPGTLVFGSYKQQATDPAILVYPTRRAGDNQWTDQYLQQVSDLVDWLLSNFTIDTNRVYVGGFSEGVHATWDLLGMRPGFFAAARILSGWQGSTSATSIKDVPLWAFHAANDGVVGVGNSRTLIRALRQAGGSPVYTEFMSGGHLDSAIQAVCIPAVNNWFLAQRRGMGSTVGPLLSITNPTQGAIYTTSATNLNLAGSAEAPGPFVTPVTWENLANNVKGPGTGSNVWNAMGIPLQANRTNLVIVTATTTSWSPAFGGNTTFNDTLAVISLPLRVSIDLVPTGVRLRFNGVPGRSYNLERAPAVTGPWSTINTQTAPASGLFEYLDTLPHPGSGFYRLLQPAAWGPAVSIDPGLLNNVNTAAMEGCLIESPDGRALFFASNRAGGQGGIDIWMARRDGTSEPWRDPVNLPSPVNSASDDFCPTPLVDGELFFVSRRPGGCGTGSADIYRTRLDPNTGWLNPVHLGCAVNSAGDEFAPSYVPSGGGMLFFSSNRDGTHKIYASARQPDGSFGVPEIWVGIATNRFTYTPAGDLRELFDGKGNKTAWGHDQYGRVTNKFAAAAAEILRYQYDANDRLTNRWSKAKANTEYGYDNAGNLTDVFYPLP